MSQRMELVAQLRARIEERYTQAKAALVTIEAYLDERDHAASVPLPDAKPSPMTEASSPLCSNRQRVFAVILRRPATVDQIAAETKLTKKEVRGVLYAKHIFPKLTIRVVRGREKSFQYNRESDSSKEVIS